VKRLRVGLLFGGRSVEHEISILSARSIAQALDPARFEVVPIAIGKDGRWALHERTLLLLGGRDPRKQSVPANRNPVVIPPYPEKSGVASAAVRRLDRPSTAIGSLHVIFPVLHGTFGEDGTVQGILELAGVPYVGCGVLGSAIGMDKDVQKRLLREAGIPVAPFATIHAHEWHNGKAGLLARLRREFRLPVFVKPANAGSSVGIRKVKRAADLAPALAFAFRFDEKALVEAAVRGREIECAVLGDEDPRASVPGEVIPRHEFYSYEAKYLDPHGADLRVPAKLPATVARKVRETAVRAFRVLELSGMARVDFFVTPSGAVYLNEVNTIPGFTAISMYPKMWEASGLPYPKLLEKLIAIAIARSKRRARLQTSL